MTSRAACLRARRWVSRDLVSAWPMDLSATQRDKGDNKENGLTVFVHTIVWFLTRHTLWIKSQIIWTYPKYPSGKEPIRSVCRREVTG